MNIIRKILCLHIIAASLISQVPAQEIIQVVKEGNFDRVKFLLENNPDLVNSKDTRNCTPLHYASDRGNLEIVKILLKNDASQNACDIDGDTPLHWAAFAGGTEIAELLINKGSDVNSSNNTGNTPFNYALNRKQVDVVNLFVDMGVELYLEENGGRQILHQAASGGFARTAKKLNLPTKVVSADKRGDRYFYSNSKLK